MFRKHLLIQSIVLACSLLISGCSQTAGSTSITATTTVQTTSSTDPTLAETTESKNQKQNITYDYKWDNNRIKDFSSYVNKKLGKELAGYVICYGFTDELNKVYTQYINEYYGTDYDMVPFSASNYFYSYLVDDDGMHRYRKNDIFYARFLNSEKCTKGTFNNKLIMSYMIQNNIPFGTMINVNNYKNIDVEFIKIGKQYDLDYYRDHYKLGNYDKSYKYSSGELIAILQLYNSSLSYIFYSEGIKDLNLLNNQELCDILNQHLKKFYGEKAPQIGQVPTAENYRAMFGEEPLDLSYIPGAVIK